MTSYAPPCVSSEPSCLDNIETRSRGDFTLADAFSQGTEPPEDNGDIANRTPNLYRIFVLISEVDSGRPVEKIIVAQDGLEQLINDMSPGTYISSTRIDFKALDSFSIRPIGVYGDRIGIINFLSSLEILDECTLRLLQDSKDNSSGPSLQSGIYIAKPKQSPDVLYAVYWPQDTTWEDDAPFRQRENRIMFMRYLTEISEQILCFMSPGQSEAFVWNHDDVEESTISRPGFLFDLPPMQIPEVLESEPDPVSHTALMLGECAQGILSTKFLPPRIDEKVTNGLFTPMRLREFLSGSIIRIECELSEKVVIALVKDVLDTGVYQQACADWRERREVITKDAEEMRAERMAELYKGSFGKQSPLEKQVMAYLVSKVLEKYPCLDPVRLSQKTAKITRSEVPELKGTDEIAGFVSKTPLHPSLIDLGKRLSELPWAFLDQKYRVVCVRVISRKYGQYYSEDLVRTVVQDGCPEKLVVRPKDYSRLLSFLPAGNTIQNIDIKKDVIRYCELLNDRVFLANLDRYVKEEPLVEPATRLALDATYDYLSDLLAETFGSLMPAVIEKQQKAAERHLALELDDIRKIALNQSADVFIEQINSISDGRTNAGSVVILESLEINPDRTLGDTYTISARRRLHVESALECQINRLEIPSDHRHNLQIDSVFIPLPYICCEGSITFTIPPNHQILHSQLLGDNRILLIIDEEDRYVLYLDTLFSIGDAVQRGQSKRLLCKDELGGGILLNVDETQRLLVLCAPQEHLLRVFKFDENFRSLQSWAKPLELTNCCNNVTIMHICVVAGTDEVLLVDSSAQAHKYSFVKQQLRLVPVVLPTVPISVMSSPDGACVLFVFQVANQKILTVYHWDTFGTSEGTTITLPGNPENLSVTSFVNRTSVHLMMLEKKYRCQSLALSLARKKNNCLLDCFGDVWTQFPVVPAVSRGVIIPSAMRRSKAIILVSDRIHSTCASYFSDMIRKFEAQTKKPTNEVLQTISIHTGTYSDVNKDSLRLFVGGISQFSAGQWFVNFLCLLPIQIAVVRDNSFRPLKDGVSSAEFERSLLGAAVGQIVDDLSFGWYESILRSYGTRRPVKVVSPMGEQHVGKSFALNHLLDTSFAGSITGTKGVWMSIIPTDEALLVAFDFQGVRSIGLSPQEDALLVLFASAISNLVLFRNNFALSRDIDGLFQSFEASSMIIDPAANPSLFQSTFVVILKDVESKSQEVVREFVLKLQMKFREEQGTNFISRLYSGGLNIISWPTIESSSFYTLLPTLKHRLDSQIITYSSAGKFLNTLKLWMAKIKANDWSSMSKSLATHRAQTMLAILPAALQFGLTSIGPESEPLKNLDNDTVIECPDTPFVFFLSSQPQETWSRKEMLASLKQAWGNYNARHEMDEVIWVNELGTYLNDVVNLRIAHVESWISVNLRRSEMNNTQVKLLQREMVNGAADLLANVELCKMTCSSCLLSCTLSRRHDPTLESHDCDTDHQCPYPCEYAVNHAEGTWSCRSPAGHDWPHICAINKHVCGEACTRSDMKGCEIYCAQMVGHAGTHLCSARKHMCGKPCALQIVLFDGSIQYTCPGICSFPYAESHDRHACDDQACPLACKLCRRLCENSDHLHGLDNSSVHLCGESHNCQEFCSAGICMIDCQSTETTQSWEITLNGSREVFQGVKFNQSPKRLRCVKSIPAGQYEHEGQHIHSLDPSPFHFCEISCGNCGNFCTLPQGHPQEDHETAHGSMSRTRWAAGGPEGTSIEVDGHCFAANDEGALMLCNLVCLSMGRHVHLDDCRTDPGQTCAGPDHEHVTTHLTPHSGRPKDWISHSLYWKRLDPYSLDDQRNFAKCDAMCPGPEHATTANQVGQPSYCTLPIFHPPFTSNSISGLGYVSNDGHLFSCTNPAPGPQIFHVIFVISRSGSMRQNTPSPLHPTHVAPSILRHHNNILGAVYLFLYAFWQSRKAVLTRLEAGVQDHDAEPIRRDAYSVILFNHTITRCFENDFQRTPEDLLQTLLQYEADGGTNCEDAIRETESIIRDHWSAERLPVVIFISNGECSIHDSTFRSMCCAANSLGRPLSFHAVSLGRTSESLRRMSQIAREVEATAPWNPSLSADTRAKSSYAEALDSVQLQDTFLGASDSFRKTRAALFF